MNAHFAPAIFKHLCSYKKLSTFLAGFVVIGVLTAGFMIVSGRAAGLSFHWSTSPTAATSGISSVPSRTLVGVPCVTPATVYVDDSWVGTAPDADPDGGGPATQFGCDSFATIQDGINGVSSGGTVIVYSGTYTQASSISLNKSLVLQGPNSAISPNGGVRVAEALITGAPSTVLRISSPGTPVTIQGFKFDSAGVVDAYDPALNITIQRNIFSNGISGGALYFLNAPTLLTIDDNHLTNAALPDNDTVFVAGNWTGATGTVASISNNVIDNTPTANASGMNLSNVSGTISGNQFTNLLYYAILLANNSSSMTISGNVFDGMVNPDPTNVPSWGAGVRTYTPSFTGPVNIKSNTFKNSYTGVGIRGVPNDPGADITGMDIHVNFNRFVNNTFGINDGAAGTLDAENNWWGCNFGPGTGGAGCTGTPNGVGLNGTAIVDSNPWLVLGTSASPNPTTPGGNSTVTADMTHNSAAATPAGGPVATMPVAFSATEGTMAPPTGTITSGQASSTFTSTSNNSGTGCSTVDGQLICTAIGITLPAFTIDDVTHNEGDAGTTSYTFTITKNGASGFNTSVDYATVNGSATAPSDFTAIPTTTVVFLPSDTTKQVTVFVNGDMGVEPDEAFTVHLSNPSGATISDADGTGTVTNDDVCAAFATVYVDDSWVGTVPGTDPDAGGPATKFGCDSFATIQEGINAVTNPGTVIVYAGNYAENVFLNKSLSLRGAQFGVDARGRVAAESIVTPASAARALELRTGSAGSVIDGFTFSGGTLVAVSGLIESTSGPLNNLQLSNNRFTSFLGRAVNLNDTGTDITVNQNEINGSSNTTAVSGVFHLDTDLFNGFQFTNNTVTGAQFTEGFFVDGSHNVGPSLARNPQISGNVLSNNSVGANLGSRAFGSQLTPNAGTISNNTFNNNKFDGLQGGMQNVLISGNTFSNNGRTGLALTSFGSVVADRETQNSLIVSNTITGNGFITASAGLTFSNAQAAGTISTNQAHFNRIVGNATGVLYSGTESINIENNWWGCNFGPGTGGTGCTGTPNGKGGTGAANLDADPWIVLGTSASPSTIITGTTTTVTADMTHNSTPATPAGGPVPQVSVAFSATDGTMFPTSGTITAGQASSTFTSTSTNLTATASSTVDSQVATTNITVLSPSNVFGTKTWSGTRLTGSTITYTVVLSNTNTTPQLDNPTDEFTDTLPSSLTLVSASATSGTTSTGANTVTWNGSIAGSGSVTITITATINLVPDTTPVSNQGTINYDFDGNHTNESVRLTDDPGVVGASNPTVFNAADTNDPPDAVNDGISSVAEDSGQRTITIASLLTNDNTGPANESGQTLTMTSVSNPVGGTVIKDAINVYFTPAPDFNGPASFDYTIQDNGTSDGANDFKSDTATVSFTVTEVNDEPTAVNDVLGSVAEDSGQRIIPFSDLTGNDNKGAPNESGQTLIVKTVDNEVGGTAVLDPPNSRVLFTPAADYHGAASFEYTIEDNGTTNGASDPKPGVLAATASFTITPVADTPSVTNATTSMNTQTESDLFISRNPVDGDEVTHFKITNITNGTLFQTDGTTPINNGDFITYAQASTGLKFTPANGLSSPGSTFKFDIQASTSNNDTGLGGSVITATITVSPSLILTVNSVGDGPDLGGLNGVCDADDVTPGNQCTLRAAIQETNSAATADVINFSLPANSTITLTNPLEDINGGLVITGPASGVTVSGANNVDNPFSVFSVRANKTVTVSNLTIVNGLAIKGGAIFNLGNLTLRDSTFTSNRALLEGGAIYSEDGSLTIINSTISGNSSDINGGGVSNSGDSTATLVNVTLTNNRADADGDAVGNGGGIAQSSSNPVTLRNTIVAGNFVGISPGTVAGDISGNMAAASNNNLIGTGGSGGLTNGVNNNQVGVADARLGPLANNGGPTRTHALLVASPALDAGSNCVTDNTCGFTLTTDQRGPGFARKIDGPDANTTDTVDVGAFEAQVSVQDILDRSMPEDGSDSFIFNVGGSAAITSITATSSNTALVPNSAANLNVSGSGSTRTLTINPAANQNGSTIITVTVNGPGVSMTDTFVLTVWEVNDAPTAVNDTLSNVAEDSGQRTILGTTLTANDSKGPANESSQTLIVKTVGNAVGGTVSLVGGNVLFTTAADYNGPASFDYTVEDNGTTNGSADPKTSGPATASFIITEVNDAPVAVNDPLGNMEEDAPQRTIPFSALTGNDSKGPANENGQTLIVKTVSNPVGLTVSIVAGTVRYTPLPDYNGPASFQYTVEDNGTTNGVADPKTSATSALAHFNITEVNDVPTAVNDALPAIPEDSGPQTIPFSTLTANDSKGPANESSQTLIVKTVSNPVGGTVSIVAGNVVFTPAANFSGVSSFDYTVEDNGTTNGVADPKTSNTATVTFANSAVADTPSVTNATTNANTQTTSGLVISRNPADGAEVTHFKITAITGGLLFKNDGVTPINNGDFITFAEGNAGLKFTPGTTNGSFLVQASLSASNAGLGGGTVLATIIVNPLGGVIRFSAANYSVAEGAGFRTITVERSVDTSQAVTVDYVSSDNSNPADFVPCTAPGAGFASSRCDYTTAIGTLRFAAGETSKTFNVLITNDNYVEGTETLDLTLSNPSGGAVLAVPSTAVLSILDDAAEPATNPIGNAADFVRAQYHDVLNREPDAAGLAFWTDNIEKCNDPARLPAGQTVAQCIDKQRESTAIAFFMSPEFQITGGFVYHLYKGSLTGTPNYDGGSPGRFPTFLEFMHDMGQVSEGIVVNGQISGAVVEANRNALAAEFVQRPEFVARYGGLNNTLYVEELFNTTGIPATAAQKQALVDGLANATETRASVLRKVVDGTVVISEGDIQYTTTYGQAFINQENRLFVYLEYVGYLRRNPDAAGFKFWLGKLNFFDNDPFQAEMVRSFILSPEYLSRFGQP